MPVGTDRRTSAVLFVFTVSVQLWRFPLMEGIKVPEKKELIRGA
jgi:hypothetical protein